MARVAVRHVAEVFDSAAVVLAPDASGRLNHPAGSPLEKSFRGADLSVAQWVVDHGECAGSGRTPAGRAGHLPAAARDPPDARRARRATDQSATHLLPEQRRLLETFAGQIALALERAALGEEAATARIAAETEGLRNTLLASISHDLRTRSRSSPEPPAR